MALGRIAPWVAYMRAPCWSVIVIFTGSPNCNTSRHQSCPSRNKAQTFLHHIHLITQWLELEWNSLKWQWRNLSETSCLPAAQERVEGLWAEQASSNWESSRTCRASTSSVSWAEPQIGKRQAKQLDVGRLQGDAGKRATLPRFCRPSQRHQQGVGSSAHAFVFHTMKSPYKRLRCLVNENGGVGVWNYKS